MQFHPKFTSPLTSQLHDTTPRWGMPLTTNPPGGARPDDFPAATPFSPDQARQMAEDLGWDEFEMLVRDFLDDLPGELGRLSAQLSAGARQDLQRSAHNLKAASFTFGLSELAEALLRLELAAETADSEVLSPWLDSLSALSAQGKGELREWLQLGRFTALPANLQPSFSLTSPNPLAP